MKNEGQRASDELMQFLEDHLETIRKSFDSPERIRLAIVMWDVSEPEGGLFLTNSSLEIAMKELLYLSRTRDAIWFSGETIH